MIGADGAGAFSAVQGVVVGLVVLSAIGTLGLYHFGLPAGLTGLAFVLIFAVLMGLSWTRFEETHPRHERSEGK